MKTLAVCLAVGALIALGGAVSVQAAEPVTVTFGSGTDWSTFDLNRGGSNPNLGAAQLVCMNGGSPFPCPASATNLNAPFSGWFANRSAIPGAEWIWAPSVDGSTAPAELQSFLFSAKVMVDGQPTTASLSLAADDFAEAWVNGRHVGSVGSVVDPNQAGAHNFLTAFDISDLVHPGVNMIYVRAQNGPATWSPFCTDTCTYAQNPAGVLFGGSITTG
jgi:hypothetical protein